MSKVRRGFKGLALVAVALLLYACAGAATADYERHNQSRLRTAHTGEGFVFEAESSARYPADDAVAETLRMRWLASWMKLRSACPQGYSVNTLDRATDLVSPSRYDLIYAVQCRTD